MSITVNNHIMAEKILSARAAGQIAHRPTESDSAQLH